MSANEFKLLPGSVVREMKVGSISKDESKHLGSFFNDLSKGAHLDTGLLPLDGTGILAIRQALNHTQVTWQVKPGKNLVIWGKSERDPNAKTYELAQPYMVIIGDMIDGQLLGCRHFYSPVPIQTPDQILYAVNLPNTNTTGYSGTSIGWICLYHTEDWSKYTFDQKIRKLMERAAGGEAYNDNNMSSTDGPRFYAKMHKKADPSGYNKHSYLWDPKAWEKKTQQEGYEWTLNENIWIPLKVEGIDSQQAYKEDGVPLTLEMAMLGDYHAYYSDSLIKPVNLYTRDDKDNPSNKDIFDFVTKTFVSAKDPTVAKKTEAAAVKGLKVKKLLSPGQAAETYTNYSAPVPPPPPKKIGSCKHCKEAIYEGATLNLVYGAYICTTCKQEHYKPCDHCKVETHFGDLQAYNDQVFCFNCHTIYTCQSCGMQYLDDDMLLINGGEKCTSCAEWTVCNRCDTKIIKGQEHAVESETPGSFTKSLFILCVDCVSQSVICSCGYLKDQMDCGQLSNGIFACAPCIQFKDDGMPCYVKAPITVNN